jgi:hypothetical protein
MMDDELKEKFIEFIKDGKCPCRTILAEDFKWEIEEDDCIYCAAVRSELKKNNKII